MRRNVKSRVDRAPFAVWRISGGPVTATHRAGQRIAIAAAVITILVGLSAQPLKAAVVTVGNCISGGIHFATIQAAVTGVAAGSTIQVCPGNYPEQVVINKNLTLQGVESDNAFNPTLVIPSSGGFTANTSSLTSGAPLAGQIVVVSPATDVEISFLAVDGSRQQFEHRVFGCAPDWNVFQNASGTLNSVVSAQPGSECRKFRMRRDQRDLGSLCRARGLRRRPMSPSETAASMDSRRMASPPTKPGTTVRIRQQSDVGGGPIDIAQNAIQIGLWSHGNCQNNTVGDDRLQWQSCRGHGFRDSYLMIPET